MLLDEAWPARSESVESIEVADIKGRLRFLDSVRRCCDPATVPLHARALLESLASGSFEKLSFLAGNLRSCLKKRAGVDSSTRAASLIAMPLLLMTIAIFAMVVAGPVSTRAKSAAFREANPDLPALNDVIRFRYSVPNQDRRFIHVHLSGHYDHEQFKDYSDWDHYRLLGENEKKVLQQATTPGPNFSPAELLEADRRLKELMPDFLKNERRAILSRSLYRGLTFTSACLVWIAWIQASSLILFGGTIGQHLFGFALVDRQGVPALRNRLISRWLIGWVLFALANFIAEGSGEINVTIMTVWIIGVMVSVVRPQRGIHDQLSGCWLVAR